MRNSSQERAKLLDVITIVRAVYSGLSQRKSAQERRRVARDLANALLEALPSLMQESFGAEFAARGLHIDISKKIFIAGGGFNPWQLISR